MRFSVVILGASMIAGALSAQTVTPTAEGVWRVADDAGSPRGWFRIYQRSGAYDGQIVKVFPVPGDDGADLLCNACRGALKDAPALGLIFMIGMRKEGMVYDNGCILNPLDGLLYRARMKLSDDGNSLVVQVYLTTEKLGSAQMWQRVPDPDEARQLMAMPVKD